MKRTLFLIAISILLIQCAYGQLLTGTVKDNKNKQRLPFVNVGIVSKGIGTVTDTTGAFKLNLNNNDSDSLRISMIGYYPQSFLVADLKKNSGPLNVQLVTRQIQLREVK